MSIYEPVAALVREELGELSSYHPHPGDFAVRLDANEAPELLSDAAKARLAAAAVEGALSRYPDTRALALKDAIAARVGARADELLVGVGSDEVIALLLTALDKPRTRGRATIVTISPTFVMYRVSARARGLGVVEVPLDATWHLSVPAMKKAIEMAQPNLVFVASPNNPTGNAMRTEDLRALIEASHGALVLLDEAYVAYASSDLRALFEAYPNVALLGTLSKIGLAALRVGWLRASPALVREVDKVRQPYNLPAVCQRMATVALTELAHELDRTIACVIGERGRLSEEITRLGHVVTPSDANFLWVRTERPAGEIWEQLAQQGILVRSFHERGGRLANQLRVTVGTAGENDRFLEALASCR